VRQAIDEVDKTTMTQLQEQLNDCIVINAATKDISVDLSLLLTQNADEDCQREMKVLKELSNHQKFHEIFQHPLVELYLTLKWNKAKLFFYCNLIMLTVLMIAMIVYMIWYHSIPSSSQRQMSYTLQSLRYICRLGVVYVIIRESFQFLLNFKGHLGLINLMELALVWFGIEAFFKTEPVDTEMRKMRHVILILLCTFELLNILSKTPWASLSTYIAILKKVFWTFMRVLILYSIVIIAFAISFHILFVQHPREADPDDESYSNFQNFPVSLMRTIVMMTGEFDADDLKINSVFNGLVFMLFVVICTIILLNLLNALAISDTQEIFDEGRQFEKIQRVRVLDFYENCMRNLVRRKRIVWCIPKPRWFKRYEKYLIRTVFNLSLDSTGLVVIKTAKANSIYLRKDDGSFEPLPNPKATFRRCISFKAIHKHETASEEVIEAINLIVSERESKAKEITNEMLFQSIQNLELSFKIKIEELLFENLRERIADLENLLRLRS